MMVNTDPVFCRIKIFLRSGKTPFVTGIQCNKQIIDLIIFIAANNLLNTGNHFIAFRNRFQSDICLNLRIIIPEIMPEAHTGADAVTIRSCMAGNNDCSDPFQAGQNIIHCPLLLHVLFLHLNEQHRQSVLTY